MDDMKITPISAWIAEIEAGELVQLPSGKVARLRQLDVMSVIGDDGTVPNFLLGAIGGKKETVTVSQEEILQMVPMLNRLAREMFIEPKIVGSMEEVQAGTGIMLKHIVIMDKLALIPFAMGGQAAVDAMRNFPQGQDANLEFVPDGENNGATPSETDGDPQ